MEWGHWLMINLANFHVKKVTSSQCSHVFFRALLPPRQSLRRGRAREQRRNKTWQTTPKEAKTSEPLAVHWLFISWLYSKHCLTLQSVLAFNYLKSKESKAFQQNHHKTKDSQLTEGRQEIEDTMTPQTDENFHINNTSTMKENSWFLLNACKFLKTSPAWITRNTRVMNRLI